MDFYTILTNGGKNGITRAYADSSALELTSFAVGDGGFVYKRRYRACLSR